MKVGMSNNHWEVHRVRLQCALEYRAKGYSFRRIAKNLNLKYPDDARKLCAKAARLSKSPQAVIQHRVRKPTFEPDGLWTDWVTVPAPEAAPAVTRLNRSSHWQTRLFEHRLKP